jgi:hypothetical protein
VKDEEEEAPVAVAEDEDDEEEQKTAKAKQVEVETGEEKDVRSIFRGGHVHFTHFIPFTYTPSRYDLQQAYLRAGAIEAKRNALGFDFIIPMKLGNDHMSFIAVQVKNVADRIDAAPITVGTAFKHSDLKQHTAPWVAIYLHIGDRDDDKSKVTTSWLPSLNRLSIHVIGIDSLSWLDTVYLICVDLPLPTQQ